MKNKIIAFYSENKTKYDELKKELELNLIEILKWNNIHEIYWRVKEKDSLEIKIIEKNYKNIEDITDIVWLRVITYFQEDIDIIHKKISENYNISFYDSIDKRLSNPREFGYKSLHLIIKYKSTLIEIQIRTILQHAWAEIEHWIWYKSEFWIPYKIRRSFSRISSMLETCDIEFSGINKSKLIFNIDIEKEKKILENDDITLENFKEYLKKSKIIDFIDVEIANYYWLKIWKYFINPDKEIQRLKFFWIKKYWDLTKALIENKDDIIKFSSILINIPEWETPKWISIFYLCYKLISEKSNEDINEYINIHTEIYNKGIVSKKIIKLWK